MPTCESCFKAEADYKITSASEEAGNVFTFYFCEECWEELLEDGFYLPSDAKIDRL